MIDENGNVRPLSAEEIEEIEQLAMKPRPEGAGLPPIDPVKLIALLNQRITNYQAEMTHEGQTGAFTAISDLKYCIKNKLYDLEAETA